MRYGLTPRPRLDALRRSILEIMDTDRLSMTDLAARVGVPRTTLIHFLRPTSPSDDTVARIERWRKQHQRSRRQA